MPSCPFCEHYAVTEEELQRHVIKTHPDQAENPGDMLARALSTHSLPVIASNLTECCIRNEKSPEEVVELFYRTMKLLENYEVDTVSD